MTDFSAGNPIFERPPPARRASRAFVRYAVAICIGVAATLAWQSYGEVAKQIIATRVPQLGWSPEAQQMIAAFIRQLGWTKPPDATDSVVRPTTQNASQAVFVAQIPSETAPQKAPTAPPLELEQVHRMAESLVGLRQTIEQLVTAQDQMAHEIAKLQAAN